MVNINKEDKGKFYFFSQTAIVDDKPTNIIYYGTFISNLPKYQFLDRFNSEYKREETYLFEVKCFDGPGVTAKSVSSLSYIYSTLDDALKETKNTPLFHYSVLSKLK